MNDSETKSWNEVRAAFQKIWGYEDFRLPQGEIIRSLLQKQDALVVMPTGGGKSTCFQLPALLETGLTLVVSPLVALMENQVQELRDRQLPAALLHSELRLKERWQTLHLLTRQQLRLLYLSPETLLSPPVWEVVSQKQAENAFVRMEYYCVGLMGRSTVKVVHPPLAVAEIVPPKCSTSFLTNASPNPVPPCFQGSLLGMR